MMLRRILERLFPAYWCVIADLERKKKTSTIGEKLASVSDTCKRLVERASKKGIIFVENTQSGWQTFPELKIICVTPEIKTIPLEKLRKLNEGWTENLDGFYSSWNIEADIAHELAHNEIWELVQELHAQGYECICDLPCVGSEELAAKYGQKLSGQKDQVVVFFSEPAPLSQNCPITKEIVKRIETGEF